MEKRTVFMATLMFGVAMHGHGDSGNPYAAVVAVLAILLVAVSLFNLWDDSEERSGD